MQLDDRLIPLSSSAANVMPVDEWPRPAAGEPSEPQQRSIGTNAGRPKSPRWEPAVVALLDRAHAAERQIAAAWRAQAEADARLWRAEVAWQRVASFQGDGIPRGLASEALRRCDAALIVRLGSVLKADGWQARLEAVRPGPDAKVYALAILRAAMDGDVDFVQQMIEQAISTLLSLGLAANAWLRNGLRYEVLNIRPPEESPFAGAGSSLPSVDGASQPGKPITVEAQPEASCRPVSTRLPGPAAAEAPLAQYLAVHHDPSIADAVVATGLTEHTIRRTRAWKKHEERQLNAFLRDHPRARTADVKQALGFSASKTVGMCAWQEHQARRGAAKPPPRIKEVRLAPNLLHCRPDAAARDPAARVADRDELLHALEEEADGQTKVLLKRLTQAEREALLDYLVGSTNQGDELDPARPAANRVLLLEIVKQWLDDHEQEARRSSRGASAR